jgi:hypothetical protein
MLQAMDHSSSSITFVTHVEMFMTSRRWHGHLSRRYRPLHGV